MSILCDKNTKLLVQGVGRMGQFHANLSREYGTQVVGGVAPGRGGSTIAGLPIFDTVADAVRRTGASMVRDSALAVICGWPSKVEAEPNG